MVLPVFYGMSSMGVAASGLGTVECLYNMEETLKHMGMRAYDRLPVIRYNEGYMLPTLEQAGETYAIRLAEGFDMQY